MKVESRVLIDEVIMTRFILRVVGLGLGLGLGVGSRLGLGLFYR